MSRYDILANTLNATQKAALLAAPLIKHEEVTAHTNTMKKLVDLGLVTMKTFRHQSSNPLSRIENERVTRSYRITGAGCMVINRIKKAGI